MPVFVALKKERLPNVLKKSLFSLFKALIKLPEQERNGMQEKL